MSSNIYTFNKNTPDYEDILDEVQQAFVAAGLYPEAESDQVPPENDDHKLIKEETWSDSLSFDYIDSKDSILKTTKNYP